jgi:salicylate hydroxylase
VVTGDLVIAADGIHSKAVETIIGHANPAQPANHNNCAYRFLISKADLEAHEDTKFFVQSPDNTICRIYADQERNRRLVSYACRE